jgi:hypothetical protein
MPIATPFPVSLRRLGLKEKVYGIPKGSPSPARSTVLDSNIRSQSFIDTYLSRLSHVCDVSLGLIAAQISLGQIIIGLFFIGLVCAVTGSIFMFGNIFFEDTFKRIPRSEFSTYVVAVGGVLLILAFILYIVFGGPSIPIMGDPG